ncbi:hypothetical protein [Hyphococcus sp.]|uniref:hypothetical protein n=1 Tax=Hyphococcus sp. TaxID=2038636 RepID=UPI0035C68DDD
MKINTGVLISSFAALVLVAGCATTGTEQRLTVAERRAAVDEALTQPDAEQKAISDPDYDPNEIICKTIKKTGTRLGKSRDCRTAEQWRDSMTNSVRGMSEFRDSNQGARLE